MKLLRRIQYILRRRKIDAELTEEIDHHWGMRGDARALEDGRRLNLRFPLAS
jgi:hypothetical protein